MFKNLEIGETYTFVIDQDWYEYEADIEVQTPVTASTIDFIGNVTTSAYPNNNWDGKSFKIRTDDGKVELNGGSPFGPIGFVVEVKEN